MRRVRSELAGRQPKAIILLAAAPFPPTAPAQLQKYRATSARSNAASCAAVCRCAGHPRGLGVGCYAGRRHDWAIVNFDKSGELRAIMAALYPAISTPVRALEYLTNEGLTLLYERLVSRRNGGGSFA